MNICKKYKIKNYSKLKKKEIINKIYETLKNNKKELIINNKISQESIRKVQNRLREFIFIEFKSYTNKKDLIICIIEMYKYLTENLFFLIINDIFYNQVIKKIKQFKNDILIFYPEKIKDFNYYTNILIQKI